MNPSTDLEQLRSQLGGRYTIERELGRGGMGAVYLARELRLDRLVALKVLPPEFAGQSALRERFLRETRTAASFSHPNIVPVYAIEETDTFVAFAMGFVEGESLAERVHRGGPLTVRETVRLLQDVGYALAYAHGRGVVHRDIKPDNIMIERATGRALVMDFGISRTMTAPVTSHGLTRVGEVVGTPEYMSPEQAAGDSVDGRSDLYSLGLSAYFAVTGTQAISGDTTQKVLVKQLTEVIPSVAIVRGDLPAPLSQAIDRCVAKDPGARFATAEALVDALDIAQLATPDIPLPIRLFAQEVGTLGMIVVMVVLVSVMMVSGSGEHGVGDLDTMLVVVLLFSVVSTRVLQSLSEARRLAVAGYSPSDIVRGLEAVVHERETRRAELRLDVRTQQARRRTLILAALQLVMAVALIRGALALRVEIAPGRYGNPTAGVVMVISGLIMLGVSMVLLIKSPLRMPIGERLFRLVWLGPPGRWFLRIGSAGVARVRNALPSGTHRPGGEVVARAAPMRENGAQSPVAPRHALDLESRVAALEQWRDLHEKRAP